MRKNPGKDRIAGCSSGERAVCRLREQCRRAAPVLESTGQATIEIDNLFEDIDYRCRLSHGMLNMDLFRNPLGPVEKCLEDSGIDKLNVRRVVLSGGATRIPKIQSMIQDFSMGRSRASPSMLKLKRGSMFCCASCSSSFGGWGSARFQSVWRLSSAALNGRAWAWPAA